jgi:hypothetical protein
LELQHGKEGMWLEQYYDTLGATAACTLRLMEDRTGAGLRADAWFGSVKAAVALAKKG